MNLIRSPLFWFGVVAIGGGAYWYHRRSGGGLLGRDKNPEPVVVKRNMAKMPVPTETVRIGGATLRRYDMATMTIDERLKLIQDNIFKSINDPRIRHLAFQLTADCGRDDGPCEIDRIYRAVRKHVRYSSDIAPVYNPNTKRTEPIDIYSTAWRTWETRGGDCGNQVTLVASLLTVLGHTVKLRVTAPEAREDFQHIYPVVGIDTKQEPKRWMSLDTTLPRKDSKPGSEARFGRARQYHAFEVPA